MSPISPTEAFKLFDVRLSLNYGIVIRTGREQFKAHQARSCFKGV
jgi:hypothetical protein